MSKGQVFPYGFGQIGGTIEIVSDLCLTLVIYIFKQNFLSARMANLMELEQEDIQELVQQVGEYIEEGQHEENPTIEPEKEKETLTECDEASQGDCFEGKSV